MEWARWMNTPQGGEAKFNFRIRGGDGTKWWEHKQRIPEAMVFQAYCTRRIRRA